MKFAETCAWHCVASLLDWLRRSVLFGLALVCTGALSAQTPLPTPPQNQGLPYTRSARKAAMDKIGGHIVVFAGSRYAFVRGFKSRLDDEHWRDEAVLRDGVIYVPAAFAGVLSLKEVKSAPAPEGLADRWVYSLKLPRSKAQTVKIDGKPYVALADAAQALGLKVCQHPRGLLLIGEKEISFTDSEATLLDTVISQFDTPEKFADPDIATRFIPTLQRQGKWTEHVKATLEQLKIFDGPVTQWPTTPEREFDFTGFNKKLLGSKVPPPGVYPRVLFSPDDVPALAKRIRASKHGQMSLIEIEVLFKKSWWDPTTSDGQVFQKLSSGDLVGLEWPDAPPDQVATINVAHTFKGQRPGIHNSHVAYAAESLTTMALYCLLTGDDARGHQAAAAIANYWKLREPLVDQWNATSDSEFGSGTFNGNGAATHWRSMHGLVAHMNLGFSLDFAGKWMTPTEKDLVRRVIAKATYGRRAYGQDSTTRFRDVNWVSWDLPQFLALAAIEGLEGFDREAWDSNRETVRAFLDWGIDSAGQIYESNGKSPGGLQFQILSMIALARRGQNLWGHPHWRKLLEAQCLVTSPSGRVTVNSGTQYAPFSASPLSRQAVEEIKAFFPDDRCADYLLSQPFSDDAGLHALPAVELAAFDPAAYRAKLEKSTQRLRMPSPTYPGFGRGFLYDTDWRETSRAELKLPRDFNDPVHGVFSGFSDGTTNAAWINMQVRPDHYIGAGHHHSDAGMFHFSALGVDWFTESPFPQNYEGKYHNLVLVDGVATPGQFAAAASWLGANLGASVSCASADLTYAYAWRWLTQPEQEWSAISDRMGNLPWAVEPSPRILEIFAGLSHWKMRPWWSTYNYCNWIPTSRAPFNPMQRVFRSVGLVRGTHPFGFVVDDVRKDDQARLYQWTACLNDGVWRAEVPGLSLGQLALARREVEGRQANAAVGARAALTPANGESLLLVCALAAPGSGEFSVETETAAGPEDRNGKAQTFDRVVLSHRGPDANFRVFLLPVRFGEPLPQVTFDSTRGVTTVVWPGQRDEIQFMTDVNQRTRVIVTHDGKKLGGN